MKVIVKESLRIFIYPSPLLSVVVCCLVAYFFSTVDQNPLFKSPSQKRMVGPKFDRLSAVPSSLQMFQKPPQTQTNITGTIKDVALVINNPQLFEEEEEEECDEIERLVMEIKKKLLFPLMSSDDLVSCVSVSAYDTAWVAMVPADHENEGHSPKFQGCLNWILQNQNADEGYWGELRTIECLTATLACVVALNKWNVDGSHDNSISKGLDFINSNTENLLMVTGDGNKNNIPRWFAIVFPRMTEIAMEEGLILFPDNDNDSSDIVKSVFDERQRILRLNNFYNSISYPPLASYMEVLPPEYRPKDILRDQNDDGSLFSSPAATAFAFMLTGDDGCMSYLEDVTGGNMISTASGVPAMYPVDDVLIKMVMVDRLQSLGIAVYFNYEISAIINNVYNSWTSEDQKPNSIEDNIVLKLYRDSLTFRHLREKGYKVSPGRFCWFVHDNDMMIFMEENHTLFINAMYNIYRAGDLSFADDSDLEKARDFANKLLIKASINDYWMDGVVLSSSTKAKVEEELKHPWILRMDFMDQRNFIERSSSQDLLVGKASFYRLIHSDNSRLIQLAKKKFTVTQSIYREELEELQRWTEDVGLSTLGFGRQKTEYIYYAAATCLSLVLSSDVRKIITKSGVVVTLADDYFDEEGPMDELHNLSEAVQRWDGRELQGPSEVIFNALEDLVGEITLKCYNSTGHNVNKLLLDIWKQLFQSWLKEAEWSRSRQAPSIKEYLEVGMISIAINAMILPASYLNYFSSEDLLGPEQYHKITKLTMILCRLANDTQSYQKEIEDGKLNMVMLYQLENPESTINDSISYIKSVVEMKKREVLELILTDVVSNMPRSGKMLHLLTLKVFNMFFHTSNLFDSSTALRQTISRAFYDSLQMDTQSHSHIREEKGSSALRKMRKSSSNF